MAPRNWTFSGFDGQDWILLDSHVDQVGWSEGEIRMFGLTPVAEYEGYQLNVSVTNGSLDVAIGELYLLY